MIAILSALPNEIGKINYDLHVSGGELTKNVKLKTGDLYGKEVLLGHTGVGIGRARAGTSHVIQKHRPAIIIYAGLGGALSPDLRIGDIVLGSNIISLKKGGNRALFSEIPGLRGAYRKAAILTENRFVHSPELKRKLFADSGAAVVDMETWGVMEASAQSRTPVMSVRSVSDEAGETLPDMGAIYNAGGRLDFGKSIPYFSSNPKLIYPYLRFRLGSYPKAVRTLNGFLADLLRALSDDERIRQS